MSRVAECITQRLTLNHPQSCWGLLKRAANMNPRTQSIYKVWEMETATASKETCVRYTSNLSWEGWRKRMYQTIYLRFASWRTWHKLCCCWWQFYPVASQMLVHLLISGYICPGSLFFYKFPGANITMKGPSIGAATLWAAGREVGAFGARPGIYLLLHQWIMGEDHLHGQTKQNIGLSKTGPLLSSRLFIYNVFFGGGYKYD